MDQAIEIFDTFGIYPGRLLGQLLIWLILFFVLYRFAFKPILEVLEKRKNMVEESVNNAEKIKEELANAELASKKILSEAGQEAAKILEQTKAKSSKMGEKKIQKAVEQAEEIIAKAKEAADQDREKMMVELKKEVGHLVVLTTEKVLDKSLTPSDKTRLEKDAVSSIGKN
ncbi:MAG: F0F1 ATP synthase subunit B [Verrucomicrobiota bacterium]